MDPNQIDLIIPMDWYTWLSNSVALSPSLATEYALLFSGNELEESDIPYFDHEFLQSMGISIAKHRLEILKLAKRRPLLAAIRKTKRRLASYIHSLACHRPHSSCSAIVVVPSGEGGPQWSRRKVGKHYVEMLKHAGRLMLTAGGSVKPSPRSHSEGGGDVDGLWKGGKEVVRWNSMFKDMKPT